MPRLDSPGHSLLIQARGICCVVKMLKDLLLFPVLHCLRYDQVISSSSKKLSKQELSFKQTFVYD